MAQYNEKVLKALFEDLPKNKDAEEEEMKCFAELVRSYQKRMKNVASWQRNILPAEGVQVPVETIKSTRTFNVYSEDWIHFQQHNFPDTVLPDYGVGKTGLARDERLVNGFELQGKLVLPAYQDRN